MGKTADVLVIGGGVAGRSTALQLVLRGPEVLVLGREQGVQYLPNTPVRQLLVEGGRETGVRTTAGDYHAPVVVNDGGPCQDSGAGLE